MRPILRSIVILPALALALSACGGGPSAALKTQYVEVQAQRLCDIQKQTYPSKEALDQSYKDAITKAGISAADEKKLSDYYDDNRDFRTRVSDRYKQICPPDTTPTSQPTETTLAP